MRIGRFGFLLALALLVLFAAVVVSQAEPPWRAKDAPKASEKLVFAAKPGAVTFLHAKHAERLKGDCKACHPVPFKQDAKAPLNYKAGLHKTAEKAKASCAACHVATGTAFATANNCTKCHQK